MGSCARLRKQGHGNTRQIWAREGYAHRSKGREEAAGGSCSSNVGEIAGMARVGAVRLWDGGGAAESCCLVERAEPLPPAGVVVAVGSRAPARPRRRAPIRRRGRAEHSGGEPVACQRPG
jgi:hypothetical protein